MNKYLLEDYKDVSDTIKKLGFKNNTILVTGANGTLGSFLINSFLFDNKNNNNKIIAISRRANETKKLFNNNKNVTSLDYSSNLKKYKIDYIFHFASPTNSKYFVEKPIETLNIIVELTKYCIELANQKHSKMIYVSSMEVYGNINDNKERLENQLGELPLDNPRSSYPLGKRISEFLCNIKSLNNKVNISIGRLAQTFGASSNPYDTRIFSYAARCVKDKKNIELASDGKSIGNYVYLSDAITALLYIAKRGKSGETYNIVNNKCRKSIYELCDSISKKRVQIILNKGKNYYPKNTKLKMANKKIIELGWKPKNNYKKMILKFLSTQNL